MAEEETEADTQGTAVEAGFVPLHVSKEPHSYSADALTYVADQKVPLLLEWISTSIVKEQPRDVLDFVRNLTASKQPELLDHENQFSPALYAQVLSHEYVAASDKRKNDNEIDETGLPKRVPTPEPQKHHDTLKSSIQHLELTYFSHRGRCDLPWMLLVLSDVPHVVTWTKWDDFVNMRDTLPFGQLPVLQVSSKGIDGTDLNQWVGETLAISRFLSRIGGYVPQDPVDAAAMDSLVVRLQKNVRSIELFTAATAEDQDTVFTDITTSRLPPVLRSVERTLKVRATERAAQQKRQSDCTEEDTANNGETSKIAPCYLCGDNVSWGDLALYCELDMMFRWGATVDTLFGHEFPETRAWLEGIMELKPIKEFVKTNWDGKDLRW